MGWSTTQGVVAPSSGEAELYAMVKGAANTIGLISLAADFGLPVEGKIHCDASAAIGIVNRTGVGKLRHVRVQYLWLQGKVRNQELCVSKVRGDQNPADLLTKHVAADLIARYCHTLGMERLKSRAACAPRLDALSAEAESVENNLGVENKTEDEWEDTGDQGKVTRQHRKWRSELFTPIRVQGAPPGRALTSVRITEGKYEDGQAFRKVDSWTTRSTAHLRLDRRWIGSTTFLLRRG